jgi:hypothetical protein
LLSLFTFQNLYLYRDKQPSRLFSARFGCPITGRQTQLEGEEMKRSLSASFAFYLLFRIYISLSPPLLAFARKQGAFIFCRVRQSLYHWPSNPA